MQIDFGRSRLTPGALPAKVFVCQDRVAIALVQVTRECHHGIHERFDTAKAYDAVEIRAVAPGVLLVNVGLLLVFLAITHRTFLEALATPADRISFNLFHQAPCGRPLRFFHNHIGISTLVPVTVRALHLFALAVKNTAHAYVPVEVGAVPPGSSILVEHVGQGRIDLSPAYGSTGRVPGPAERILFQVGCNMPAGTTFGLADKANVAGSNVCIGFCIVARLRLRNVLRRVHGYRIVAAKPKPSFFGHIPAQELFKLRHGIAQAPACHMPTEIGQFAGTFGGERPVGNLYLCRRVVPLAFFYHGI